VQAYARRYSDEVAGVVAMNPVPPWGPWSKKGFQKMTPQERQEGCFSPMFGPRLGARLNGLGS
jgi:hypothetical protein